MICHQTVPVVPPHLAEDGIALIAPSSLYLAWGKSPSQPAPSAGKLFSSPPQQLQALELDWTSRQMVVPPREITQSRWEAGGG